jgi:sugar transferase (PEP-CTERM system associated)
VIRLFRVFVPAGILILLISEVLLVACSFLLAAFLTLGPDPVMYLLYEGGIARIAVVVGTMVLAMHLQDLYSQVHVGSRTMLLTSLCTASGLTFLFEGFITYMYPGLRAPIRVLVPGGVLSILAILVWRPLYGAVFWKMSVRRVLFVGGSALLEEAAAHLSKNRHLGLELIGYVSDEEKPPAGAKVIGPISQLREIVEAVRPDAIVLGMEERRNRAPMSELLELRFQGFAIEEEALFFESVCGRISIKHVRPSQLIFSSEFAGRSDAVYRVIDFAIALTGIVVLLPVMLITALAIKFSSHGPVLYRQTRVGRNNVPFVLYKFRSMYAEAEKNTGAVWSKAHDPRITPVGRIIRNLRLDEVPQLFNVLRGNMAIVGPRPERPEFVNVLSAQIPFYRQRHAIKPGITGWAQVNYKYGETFEDAVRKLEYDLYYIKHMSLSLNNYIIFATAKVMLLGRGAQ